MQCIAHPDISGVQLSIKHVLKNTPFYTWKYIFENKIENISLGDSVKSEPYLVC